MVSETERPAVTERETTECQSPKPGEKLTDRSFRSASFPGHTVITDPEARTESPE